MSLLPSRMSINDPMPSLGELVKEAIQPKRDPIKEFETGDHQMRPGNRVVIKAAREQFLDGLGAFDGASLIGWAGSPAKTLRRVAVTNNPDGLKFEPARSVPDAATPSATKQDFKVGDRIRPTYPCAGWKEATVAAVNTSSVSFWIDGKEWLDFFNDIELIPSAPAQDGWIEGELEARPVTGDTLVSVRLSDGEIRGPGRADSIVATWGKHGLRVVAYCLGGATEVKAILLDALLAVAIGLALFILFAHDGQVLLESQR